MNYIVSSIILLSVILVIIYMLSIDNNGEKMYNKMKELLSVIKSKKINYLSEKDNINLLNYIKYQFPEYNNIIIPTRIYYNKTVDNYIIHDINIICYKIIDAKLIETPYTITITFTPINKEHYISCNSLFGLMGHFNIINLPQFKINENNTNIIDNTIDTDIFNMIPDIIHLSESDTTDTTALIARQL